jgi:cytochrome c peroxidase
MKTNRKNLAIVLVAVAMLVAAVFVGSGLAQDTLTPKEQLGKNIFFDEDLSLNENQSCASCHGPEAGWTGPESDTNAAGAVYEGSIAGRFGDRKPPSAAYATLSPVFYQDNKGLFVGGNFWDGRATGEVLGNPAADQALGPFLNPKEQALPDSACVVYRVCTGAYGGLAEEVWGAGACGIVWPVDVEDACAQEGTTVTLSPEDRTKSDRAYGNIGLTVAAYEDSAEVNAFSSKYDQTFNGKVKLSKQEQKGFALFQGQGKCKLCHMTGKDALFTDFTFDNLGVPSNPENPANVADPAFVDPGLGGFLKSPQGGSYPAEVYEAEWGKHKVPTLRNVDLRPDAGFVKAYGHNGYFKSLEEIVHFYNTRDVLPTCDPSDPQDVEKVNCWPPPEVPQNVNTDELGDLGLTPEEEAAIVAFLRALSDGYLP